MKKGQLSIFASLMCANQLYLADDIKTLEKAGVDGFHLDIMDGQFVPNITLGFPVLEAIRPITSLPIAAHLMINEPGRFIRRFVKAGADIISFHYESSQEIEAVLEMLNTTTVKKAMAIKPGTEIEAIFPYLSELDIVLVMSVEPGFAGGKFVPAVIDRIRRLAEVREVNKYDFKIEVDGNINTTTVPLLYEAGAEVFIGGSTGLFIKGVDFTMAVNDLRKSALKERRDDIG